MPVITCQNLCKTYGGAPALQQLNCALPSDAIIGLIGPNGAGKTTLLKCIAGFYRPCGGTIRVFDQDPFDNLAVSSACILVDDSMTFPEGLNLAQILTIFARCYAGWDHTLADRLLDYFGLPPAKRPEALSKGMLSTFRSIIGLCAHAPLTIMDEPTTGMDAGVRQDFYRALLKDYLAYPRTIIIASHLLGEIEDILEYILLIDHGREVLAAPAEDFRRYALTLQGPLAVLAPLLERRTVLHREDSPLGYSSIAVVNDFTADELEQLLCLGITPAAVSANDLCIYLTNSRQKGGIDHVFARD